jgi:hypothetical protein
MAGMGPPLPLARMAGLPEQPGVATPPGGGPAGYMPQMTGMAAGGAMGGGGYAPQMTGAVPSAPAMGGYAPQMTGATTQAPGGQPSSGECEQRKDSA